MLATTRNRSINRLGNAVLYRESSIIRTKLGQEDNKAIGFSDRQNDNNERRWRIHRVPGFVQAHNIRGTVRTLAASLLGGRVQLRV